MRNAMEYLRADVTARANREDAAVRRLQLDYVRELTAIGGNELDELRYSPRSGRAGGPPRPPRTVPVAADASQPEHDAALRDLGGPGR